MMTIDKRNVLLPFFSYEIEKVCSFILAYFALPKSARPFDCDPPMPPSTGGDCNASGEVAVAGDC